MQDRPIRAELRAGCGLVLAVLAVYGLTLGHGFVWDDDGHLTKPALHGLAGLARIWSEPSATQQYYPLLHTLFWVEDALFGHAPAGYHAVNVLLHAAVALGVWRLALRLALPGAWGLALVFALHPVQVESVAWISEQKNTLSALFYVLAWQAWLAFERRGCAREHAAWWLASLALAACACLSKTVTASLAPAILLATWWRDGGWGWLRRVPWLAPHLALGIGLGLVTAHVEVAIGGAGGPGEALTLLERCVVAGKNLFFYLYKLALPLEQVFIYPRWSVGTTSALQLLIPAAFMALLAALFALRERLGRGPFAALAFFAGTLTPALGFFDVIPFRFSFVADHFQYLAVLGPLALAAAAWTALKDARARRALGGLAIVALGALSFRHARAFESEERLWRDTLAKNPAAWIAWENLLNLLNVAGRHGEALELAEQAERAPPEHALRGRAALALQAGIALQQTGRVTQAVQAFEEFERRDPDNYRAPFNLGSALLDAGRPAEALPALERALALEPGVARTHMLRANALLALARIDAALTAYARARELAPQDAEVWFNSGVGQAQAARPAEALECYERALALDPAQHAARLNRAVLWAKAGRTGEARAEFELLLRVAPGTLVAQRALQALQVLGGPR